MILSLLMTSITIVCMYRMLRKKYKMMNQVAENIKADNKNHDKSADHDREIRIVKSTVLVHEESDKDEDLYDNNKHKIRNKTVINTTKGEDTDLEGGRETVEGECDEKIRKQHNNVDNEGNELFVENDVAP